MAISDDKEKEEETKGDHAYFDKEKEAEAQFDQVANQLAGKFYQGQEIPWFQLTELVVWILFVLNLLQMLKKPAFMTLTVNVLAIYVLHNTHHITRQTFRGLVALLAFSWLYDAVWMLVLEPSAADEDMEDGGHEWKIRRFVKFVSLITLFFKLVVLAVFWKDSLDFRKIIRKK